jgi:hypothetical protein
MRKKLLFVTLTIVISVSLVAQVEKGRIYPALTLGKHVFDYNTNTVQPSISIGLNEHSTIGVFYQYTRYKFSPSDFSKGFSEKTGGGVSYNYYHYFGKRSRFGWYINGELGVYRVSVFDQSGSTTVLNNRYTETQLKITPGIFYSLSPRVMLFTNVGGLAFNHSAGRGLDITGRDMFNQVNIGIRVSFGGSKKAKKISIQ